MSKSKCTKIEYTLISFFSKKIIIYKFRHNSSNKIIYSIHYKLNIHHEGI